MLEIEMKFPVSDFAPIVAKLKKWKARQEETLEEADHYHNAPDRDFAKTDEAFRLRRCGPTNVVTYKGPRHPGQTKTRTEIEVALASGDEPAEDFCRLLAHLGYRAVAVVRKMRVCYYFERGDFGLQVCLDEVDEVGRYVEVEIVAPKAQKAAAEKVLLEVVADLELKNSERRSYLEMLLHNTGAERNTP